MSDGNTTHRGSVPRGGGRQLREAFDRLQGLMVEGLRHGFFDYSVSCEIIQGQKRRLTIKAGKSHRFTIPEDELPE
jgi:hypothetical protein